MKKLFIFFITACTMSSLLAQQAPKEVRDHSQVWTAYFNQTRLSDKWGIWLDVHARRTDFLDRWNTMIFRPGLTYYLNDHVRLTAGYAYVAHFPASSAAPVRPEHRPWQQVMWTSRSKKLQTLQWVRLEERFNRKVANNELLDEYAFNFRVRYQISLMVPLKGDFIQLGTPFLVLSDEIHINAGKQITYNYFDQNRFFLGLGYQFSKTMNVQLGYMNLFQQLPTGNQFNNNHALRLFFFHNLDLRRKDG
jgi:hypothetical protein